MKFHNKFDFYGFVFIVIGSIIGIVLFLGNAVEKDLGYFGVLANFLALSALFQGLSNHRRIKSLESRKLRFENIESRQI